MLVLPGPKLYSAEPPCLTPQMLAPTEMPTEERRWCQETVFTWVFGLPSKQSQCQASLDAFVPVDGRCNTGKDLKEGRTSQWGQEPRPLGLANVTYSAGHPGLRPHGMGTSPARATAAAGLPAPAPTGPPPARWLWASN